MCMRAPCRFCMETSQSQPHFIFWELKLSAKLFPISSFLKYFLCCVRVYLSLFSHFFSLCLTASDMKKDIDTLITQEKAEIIAKYEKVPALSFSPTHQLRLEIFGRRVKQGCFEGLLQQLSSFCLLLPAHPLSQSLGSYICSVQSWRPC